MSTPDNDLRDQAVKAFDRFQNVYFDFDDFWKRSNTFDGALQFVTAVRKRWPDQSMEGIDTLIQKNIKFFEERMNSEKVWQDDYGWCGAACLSAYAYCNEYRDKKNAADYLQLAKQCWDNMVNYGWDGSGGATPVPHGCRNKDREQADGTKNTVTNATFLRLCLNLYSVTRETQYLDKAKQAYAWFDAWFHPPQAGYPDSLPYLMSPKDDSTSFLIAERPWAAASYHNRDQPDWEEGWAWTGDHGLMLIALAEYYIVVGSSQGEIDILKSVAPAVKRLMFDEDDVLQEAPFKSSFDAKFAKDYVGGRGVLMRHLASDHVRFYVDFSKQIVATANAVWASRDPANQFPADWNPNKKAKFAAKYHTLMGYGDGSLNWGFVEKAKDMQAILQGAGLDALGAAIRVTTPA